jgi:hypothetical protein
MLVRVRVGDGLLIPVPIPLFLLDQTLDIIEDLAWLAEKFVFPGMARSGRRDDQDRKNFRLWFDPAGSPTLAVKLCREMIGELRSYGKWRMVEVEARHPKKRKQVRVYVDFM